MHFFTAILCTKGLPNRPYVACMKYRRKAISPSISTQLKEVNLGVSERFGITFIEQKTDLDHIHTVPVRIETASDAVAVRQQSEDGLGQDANAGIPGIRAG